jgi:hypothetical protein
MNEPLEGNTVQTPCQAGKDNQKGADSVGRATGQDHRTPSQNKQQRISRHHYSCASAEESWEATTLKYQRQPGTLYAFVPGSIKPHTGPLCFYEAIFSNEGTIVDLPHQRAGAVSGSFGFSFFLTLPSPQPLLSLSPLLPFHRPPLQPLAAREPLPGAPEALLAPAGPARGYPPGAQLPPRAPDHFHGGWATWLSGRVAWKALVQGAPLSGKPGAVEGGYEQGLQPGVAPGFAFCREKEEAALDNGQPLLLRVFTLDLLPVPMDCCSLML